MALGNSSGQSSGRRKGQIVIAIKERREADRYLSFTGSALDTVQRDACRLSVGTTYYHNGVMPIPRAGDIIYQQKRARGDNKFGPGYIQFQDDRGRSFTIQINDAGVVIGSILPC